MTIRDIHHFWYFHDYFDYLAPINSRDAFLIHRPDFHPTGRSPPFQHRSWVSAASPVIVGAFLGRGFEHRLRKTVPFDVIVVVGDSVVVVNVGVESGDVRPGRERSSVQSQKSADEAIRRNFVPQKSGEFFCIFTVFGNYTYFRPRIKISLCE